MLGDFFPQVKDEVRDYVVWRKIRKYCSDHEVYCAHFIHDDKFTTPFVEFLNENFDVSRQVVICQCNNPSRPIFRLPKGANVFVVTRYFGCFGTCNRLIGAVVRRIRKLIFHSLFCGNVCPFLYSHRSMLKKSYWMIWGGDLYNAPQNEIDAYVRANFQGIITDTDGDDLVYEKKYGRCAEVYRAGYTFPITWKMIEAVTAVKKPFVRVQINNSCDSSTIEMLEVLSRFKNENMRIRVVHSYGDMKWCKDIEEKGLALFGEKFEIVSRYMAPAQYAQAMEENDVLILNQNRQQGLGNCFVALALGLKLFIRSEITTYNHLVGHGAVVHDTNQIGNMTFEEFTLRRQDEIAINRRASEPFFDGSRLRELWKPVLNA